MDNSPDYSKYSLDDLYDVAKHINKDKYPERYSMVLEEIARKKQVPDGQSIDKTQSVSCGSVIINILAWGFIGFFVGGVLGTVALFSLLSYTKTGGDAATGMGGLIIIAADVGGIIGAVLGVKRAYKR